MKELDQQPENSPEDGIAAIPIPVSGTLEAATLEGCATLGDELIKNLAKLYSPRVIHPLIKDMGNDVQQYHRVLHATVTEEPRFWNMAARMLLAKQQGIVELFRAEGFDFLENEDESAYLVRQLAERPDALATKMVDVLSRCSDIGGRTFRVFKCSLTPAEAKRLFGKIAVSQMEAALAFGYRKRSYGKNPEIFKNDQPYYLGFGINRGGRFVTEPVQDKGDNRHIRYDRKCKTDFVSYHAGLNMLFVWCHGINDAPMYAEAVSTAMGKSMAFVATQQLDLSPFLDKKLGSELKRVALAVNVEGLEIRHFVVVGADRMKSELGARRWDDCLTTRYPSLAVISKKNTMRTITLRIVFGSETNEHVDVALSSTSVRVKGELDPSVLADVLHRLGVWKLNATA